MVTTLHTVYNYRQLLLPCDTVEVLCAVTVHASRSRLGRRPPAPAAAGRRISGVRVAVCCAEVPEAEPRGSPIPKRRRPAPIQPHLHRREALFVDRMEGRIVRFLALIPLSSSHWHSTAHTCASTRCGIAKRKPSTNSELIYDRTVRFGHAPWPPGPEGHRPWRVPPARPHPRRRSARCADPNAHLSWAVGQRATSCGAARGTTHSSASSHVRHST